MTRECLASTSGEVELKSRTNATDRAFWRKEKACTVKDLCEIWAMNCGYWSSICLIRVSRSSICRGSGGMILQPLCGFLTWSLNQGIAVLFLYYVLSLRCVIAHVRSVRANPNRGVALLSGFSLFLFFGDIGLLDPFLSVQ